MRDFTNFTILPCAVSLHGTLMMVKGPKHVVYEWILNLLNISCAERNLLCSLIVRVGGMAHVKFNEKSTSLV